MVGQSGAAGVLQCSNICQAVVDIIAVLAGPAVENLLAGGKVARSARGNEPGRARGQVMPFLGKQVGGVGGGIGEGHPVVAELAGVAGGKEGKMSVGAGADILG